ncbi:hypothetical protein ILYODFUR_020744 [Ilyodon furcidens]|uniref:Uncharacterized protein n=1 Tax=Ilyodon furcidens TaxID=33524 RepID=A0ABV0SN04_9TELE
MPSLSVYCFVPASSESEFLHLPSCCLLVCILGFYLASPNRMFPPTLDHADKQKADALDRWVERQKDVAMSHLPIDLEVLPSPLLLEQMEREVVQLRSPPASLVAHEDPAAKPTSSSRRKKGRRGAPACVSASKEESPTAAVATPGVITPKLAAASKPASSSATAQFPRLSAAPPMPSSLAPARCSEATPDELEQRLRFYARQIKSFRTTSIMYSSPELMERIRQMARNEVGGSKTALLQSHNPSPGLQSSAVAWQPTPGLQGAADTEQPTPGLQGAAATEQPRSGPQPDTPQPQPPPHGAEDVVRGTPRLKSSGAPATPLLTPLRVSAMPQLLRTPLRVPPTPQLLFLVCRGSVRNWSSFWPLSPATRGLRRDCRRTLSLSISRSSLSSFWLLNPETRGSRRKRRRTLFLRGSRNSLSLFWSPRVPQSFWGVLCPVGLLTYLQVPIASRHGLYASVGLHVFVAGLHNFAVDHPELCGAGPVARPNSVPAWATSWSPARTLFFVSCLF